VKQRLRIVKGTGHRVLYLVILSAIIHKLKAGGKLLRKFESERKFILANRSVLTPVGKEPLL